MTTTATPAEVPKFEWKWQPDTKTTLPVAVDPGSQPEAAERPAIKLPSIPGEFWAARTRLAVIRQAARSALVGPDMLLLALLCRLSAMRHHDLNFDLGRGKGSLNLFGGGVGGTGLGKTLANNAAQDLLIAPGYLASSGVGASRTLFKDGIGLGSGEGMIESFMGIVEEATGEIHKVKSKTANVGDPVTEKVRAQVRHNTYFFVDEGEALGNLMQRTTSILGPTIRSAWAGAALGQENAQAERTRFIGKFAYSLGMTVGFQPELVQVLLADGAAGTPQRFLWLSGYDPDVPDEDVDPVAPFELPLEQHGKPRTGLITGPEWLRKEMRDARRKVLRGEVHVEQLDSHETLMRCKLAALLAVIDERMIVNDEDWHLAGLLWETSRSIRDKLTELGKREAKRTADLKSEAAADTALRSHRKVADFDAAVHRVARGIAKTVHSGVTSLAEVRRRVPYRDKVAGYYEPALTVAVTQGWIVADDTTARVGRRAAA